MTIGEFAERLVSYCAATGASVTSFYRTPKHNKAVGGNDTSYHLLGLAGDVKYDDEFPPLERCRVIARRLGLYVHDERNTAAPHDHIRVLQ